MKNNRSTTKNDLLEERIALSNFQYSIPRAKLSSGSVNNKFPIILDGGKTIIFITDRSKEMEVRQKYEIRKTRKSDLKSTKPKL